MLKTNFFELGKGKQMLFAFLFLFFFTISLASAGQFGYNYLDQDTTATVNYSLQNVNNSQYLQGYTPQQVADLYSETDPNAVLADGSRGIDEGAWLQLGDNAAYPTSSGINFGYQDTPGDPTTGDFAIYIKQDGASEMVSEAAGFIWTYGAYNALSYYPLSNLISSTAGILNFDQNISTKGGIELLNDNLLLLFGLQRDASITYNNSDLVINPKRVGTGKLFVEGDIQADNLKANLSSSYGYNETDQNSLHLNQDNWNTGSDWLIYSNPTLDFNESKLATIYYNATQYSAVTGTVAGDLAYTNHKDGAYDDKTFNLTEQAPSPALDIRINFTNGITTFTQGIMRYRTSSIAGDSAIIQLWDYDDSDWEDYGMLVETEPFATIDSSVFDSSSHVQNGTVQMRIYKASNGNINNKYYIDWLAIAKGFGTLAGQEIDPYSYHKDESINATGFNITADYFKGDGSLLTGISSGVSSPFQYNSTNIWNYSSNLQVPKVTAEGGFWVDNNSRMGMKKSGNNLYIVNNEDYNNEMYFCTDVGSTDNACWFNIGYPGGMTITQPKAGIIPKLSFYSPSNMYIEGDLSDTLQMNIVGGKDITYKAGANGADAAYMAMGGDYNGYIWYDNNFSNKLMDLKNTYNGGTMLNLYGGRGINTTGDSEIHANFTVDETIYASSINVTENITATYLKMYSPNGSLWTCGVNDTGSWNCA